MSATGPHTVQYDPKALKELTKLDKPAARRIVKAIDALSVGPRPIGARPLVGYPELWRIRVGDYRVVYTVKDAELVILALRVAHCSIAVAGRREGGLPEDLVVDVVGNAAPDLVPRIQIADLHLGHLCGHPVDGGLQPP